MDLLLVQIKPGNALALLETLRDTLPPDLVSRTKVLASCPADPDGLPRVLARLADATDGEETQIAEIVESNANGAFQVTRGTLTKGVDGPSEATLAADYNAFTIDWLPPPRGADPGLPSVVTDTVKKILEARPSGIDFPEKTYDGDRRLAYDSICAQLGKQPYLDHGNSLTLASFHDVKKPTAPPIDQYAWDEVLSHLKTEVTYFGFASKWFDNGGHLRNTLRDQVFFDLDFATRLNHAYGLVPDDSKPMTLFADIAMTIAGRIIGTIAPTAGFMLGTIWTIAQSGGGSGSGGVIKAAIREIVNGITKALSNSIDAVEACHGAILGDCGNLFAFGALVNDGTLVWPTDGKPIRRAHAVGFHYECLRSLTKVKSEAETYRSLYEEQVWGVIQRQTYVPKPGKRHFDARTGILYENTGTKDCGNYPQTQYFLGQLHRDYHEEHGWFDHVRIAPATLAVKLFGTDDSDPTDPQLKIPFSFLESKQHRKGWDLGYGWTQSFL